VLLLRVVGLVDGSDFAEQESMFAESVDIWGDSDSVGVLEYLRRTDKMKRSICKHCGRRMTTARNEDGEVYEECRDCGYDYS